MVCYTYQGKFLCISMLHQAVCITTDHTDVHFAPMVASCGIHLHRSIWLGSRFDLVTFRPGKQKIATHSSSLIFCDCGNVEMMCYAIDVGSSVDVGMRCT